MHYERPINTEIDNKTNKIGEVKAGNARLGSRLMGSTFGSSELRDCINEPLVEISGPSEAGLGIRGEDQAGAADLLLRNGSFLVLDQARKHLLLRRKREPPARKGENGGKFRG